MIDTTEQIRRQEVTTINSQVQSDNKDIERTRLEERYGQVWDTDEMREKFTAVGFLAPYIVVKRKSDRITGTLEFQHSPRFYFNFKED